MANRFLLSQSYFLGKVTKITWGIQENTLFLTFFIRITKQKLI